MTSICFSRGSTSTKLILRVEAMASATAATMPAKAYMLRTIVASGSSAAAVIEGRFRANGDGPPTGLMVEAVRFEWGA